jgi:hypothetical protein
MSNATIWLYWEGPRPGYIDLCLQSVLLQHPDAHLLDRAGFDRLWRSDRDLPIDDLSLNHKSDFIRAYLLQHYGGLYLDMDCIVLRSLAPIPFRSPRFVGRALAPGGEYPVPTVRARRSRQRRVKALGHPRQQDLRWLRLHAGPPFRSRR